MPDDRILIVGLGNPGAKYDRTRHNCGFMALDYFAGKNGLEIRTEKMSGLYCSAVVSGKKTLLLKPMTFMNRSGDCVRAFTGFFDVAPGNILAVHDDLDLENGRIKMAAGGGAGGHNGIRSMIDCLGTKDFSRLKIGIGHPRDREETAAIPVERYVLAGFAPEEGNAFQDSLERIAEGINLFIEQGAAKAMSIVNARK